MPVAAGAVFAGTSFATGNGLAGPAEAGSLREIEIFAKDVYNNNVTQRVNAAFLLQVVGASGVSEQVHYLFTLTHSLIHSLSHSLTPHLHNTRQHRKVMECMGYPTI